MTELASIGGLGDRPAVTLPGMEIAVIEERKGISYLLAADHPEGASKAAFFEDHGFRRGAWQVLAEALRVHGLRHQVTHIARSPYGTKYVVDGPLPSPDGRMPLVRTIWIVDSGAEIPRLVTAYPLDV
ncbi:MAG: hypothetical protein IT580_24740 [Verrucomicrobiales bacterium]|nr:hypothetical protein [Verrucomicrobiales bacterium]